MSRQRAKARGLAVQAIYQWQIAGQNVPDIINQFMREHADKKVDMGYFRDLVEGVTHGLGDIDEKLSPHVDRSLNSIDPVERAILRIAAYELAAHLETPYRVIINEAIEQAKVFGAEQGHKYVNGVLDQVAKSLRPLELSAEKAGS